MLRPRAWTSQARITTINYHLCAQPLPLPKVHRVPFILFFVARMDDDCFSVFCLRVANNRQVEIVNIVDIDLNEISNCCLNSEIYSRKDAVDIFETYGQVIISLLRSTWLAPHTVRPTHVSRFCVCTLFSTAFRNQQNSHHFQLCVAVNLLSLDDV